MTDQRIVDYEAITERPAVTSEEFVKEIESIYEKAAEIVKTKNKDYGGEADPFRNFRYAEYCNVSVQDAILVRISDKFARINNLLHREEGPAVIDEKVEDTVLDMINYLAILYVWTRDRQVEARKFEGY